jgi:hypothetical protein
MLAQSGEAWCTAFASALDDWGIGPEGQKTAEDRKAK